MTLDAAYEHCRDPHRTHGRGYYLATRLLSAWKRRHARALYGFTRYPDAVGDGTHSGGRAERPTAWTARFRAGLLGKPLGDDPILPAVLHTISVVALPRADFDAFVHRMAMDLTVRQYANCPALLAYMEGSAAVIGTTMLPILMAGDGPDEAVTDSVAATREPARQLGLGFQLTNFIRDVAEDRVAFEIDRARGHYQAAEPGIAMLPPLSRRCIRVAAAVYGGILAEIERAHHDVLSRRAVVPRRRRLAALAHELGRAA